MRCPTADKCLLNASSDSVNKLLLLISTLPHNLQLLCPPLKQQDFNKNICKSSKDQHAGLP